MFSAGVGVMLKLIPHHQVILPPVINLSSEKLDRGGIFLLDDGQYLLLWVGKLAAPEAVHALFGVPSLLGIDEAAIQLTQQGMCTTLSTPNSILAS